MSSARVTDRAAQRRRDAVAEDLEITIWGPSQVQWRGTREQLLAEPGLLPPGFDGWPVTWSRPVAWQNAQFHFELQKPHSRTVKAAGGVEVWRLRRSPLGRALGCVDDRLHELAQQAAALRFWTTPAGSRLADQWLLAQRDRRFQALLKGAIARGAS